MSDQEITLRIDGAPVGKGRPRFVKATGRTFTDAKTASAEMRVVAAWEAAGRPRLPEGAIAFLVTQVVERPKTHWKRDGTLSAEGQRRPWPNGRKPDFDNAAKLLADALNGCAYRDDADVVHHWYVRRWANPGERAHTVLVLRPMTRPLDLVRSAAA
jgi:Holliday junction resolvase RusA-like endonuclease